MATELKSFEVRYLAEDGEIRTTTVEAEDKYDAERVAWNEDYGNIGSDGINKIIDVTEI